MAHDLLIQDGQAKMMYYGEAPWHGLGKKLNKPATASEAIRAAGLDWEVVKSPLAYIPRNGAVTHIAGRFALVPGEGWQGEGQPVLGIVGSQYEPLQNRDAFAFFDHIVGKGAAVYHTAGALGDGERVWILAKLPDDIRVVGDDITNKYLLLCNSHDGNSAVQIKFTPIRVVCQNTLSMALQNGRTLRVTHTRDMHQRLKQAEKLLGIIRRKYDAIGEAFVAMTKVQLDSAQLHTYLHAVFPDPVEKDNEKGWATATRDRTLAELFFVEGRGNKLPGVRGTVWAAYNGIVEYVDYRSIHTSDDRRLNSVLFGGGASTKIRAYREGVRLAVRKA